MHGRDRKLEGSLSEIYAERLGMSKEEVKQTYFDGEDIADRKEALDLGFIDDIYDADPVPADSTPAQIYTYSITGSLSHKKTEKT